MSGSRPIIVITGANNGVGFGLCRRLLYQLSQPSPSEARPIFERTSSHESANSIAYPCIGLTLVMACRNRQRAETARAELMKLFEEDVEGREKQPGEAAHLKNFRQNLVVKIHSLDLASIHSVLDFSDDISRTYPYISHIFCNAGIASFTGISWPALAKHVLTNFLDAVTNPNYNLQKAGILSEDGLGLVWQCNVFGHYVLVRQLEPLLIASRISTHTPARVIWTSSLASRPEKFDSEDWKLTKSFFAYEASKYQIDIIRAELDRRALLSSSPAIRHFTFHPGVVYTSIDKALLGPVLHRLKLMTFYVARYLGSPHHTITTWHGAAAGVHLALVSLAFLPVFLSSAKSKVVNTDDVLASHTLQNEVVPVRFSSTTDRRGIDGTGVSSVAGWVEHRQESEKLVNRCEKLYQVILTAEGRLGSSEMNNA